MVIMAINPKITALHPAMLDLKVCMARNDNTDRLNVISDMPKNDFINL